MSTWFRLRIPARVFRSKHGITSSSAFIVQIERGPELKMAARVWGWLSPDGSPAPTTATLNSAIPAVREQSSSSGFPSLTVNDSSNRTLAHLPCVYLLFVRLRQMTVKYYGLALSL